MRNSLVDKLLTVVTEFFSNVIYLSFESHQKDNWFRAGL